MNKASNKEIGERLSISSLVKRFAKEWRNGIVGPDSRYAGGNKLKQQVTSTLTDALKKVIDEEAGISRDSYGRVTLKTNASSPYAGVLADLVVAARKTIQESVMSLASEDFTLTEANKEQIRETYRNEVMSAARNAVMEQAKRDTARIVPHILKEFLNEKDVLVLMEEKLDNSADAG